MPLDVTGLDLDTLMEREWLAVNHIGGYASSTVAGLNTRKYHGLLVAAMSPPVKRMVLLSRVEEVVTHHGWTYPLACNEYPGTIHPRGDQSLVAFDAGPFPRWAYRGQGGPGGQGWTLEKSLCMVQGQNTVVLSYALLGGDQTVDLELRPLFALRGIHELMYQWNGKLQSEQRSPGHHRIAATSRTPEVFYAHDGAFESQPNWYLNSIYRREQERGYAGLEDLWTPGVVRWTLRPGQVVHFACAADPLDLQTALTHSEQAPPARSVTTLPIGERAGVVASDPIDSADQQTLELLHQATAEFLVELPPDRACGAAQADYVMAGYPWSPPSPRQTLIGFTGLLLVPGRFDLARRLLLALADRLVDGLLPSALVESGDAVYRGADVSLWFVNAVLAYFRYSGDESALRDRLLDAAVQIVDRYRRGTRLDIATDSAGLLHAGQPGIAVTWMDAQVGDWVLTPRNGLAVEINALWYNAVRSLAWLQQRLAPAESAESAAQLETLAASIKSAFNIRFWNASAHCCFDVIDGDSADACIRPNQLLAISLPFPVLDSGHWDAVVECVRNQLLVPTGVRTLAPTAPMYQGHYGGNVISRDLASHNGSALPFLLGAYVTAYLRVHGRGLGARSEARQALAPAIAYVSGPGLGHLSELFDGDRPHRPGGVIASAAAVGEVLRAFSEDCLDRLPALPFPLHPGPRSASGSASPQSLR
jgi:predicted glycogen debranching enzyme